MNYRIDVTDEMIGLGAEDARAWGVKSMHGGWSDEETQRSCTRDILEAVAPLIAAQALRDFADGMTSGLNKETLNAERRAIKREARDRADEIEAGR